MKLIHTVFLYCLILGCANVTPLTGGEKDILPPELLSSSPDSAQLNFFSKTLKFEFDENIKLSNLKKELIVSPPISDEYKHSVKGKVLTLEFEEFPKLETTYIINFGNSIQDVNEYNIYENFTAVFSSGSVIDTSTISGKVIDSKNNFPISDASVMLYSIYSDSIPFFGKPYYLSRTDDMGFFKFKHLADAKYHLIILEDKNSNRKLDEGEKFGFFLDSNLINRDSLELKVFNYQAYTKLKAKYYPSKQNNYHTIGFNQIIKSTKIKNLQIDPPADFSISKNKVPWILNDNKDTLIFYYPASENIDSFNISFIYDTTNFELKAKNKILSGIKKPNIKNTSLQILPVDSAILSFNTFIKKVRTQGMKCINAKDSTLLSIDSIRIDEETNIILYSRFTSGSQFHLIIDSNVIHTYDNTVNDSIRLKINVQNRENLSQLKITPILDSSIQHKVYAVLYTKSLQKKPVPVKSGSPLSFNHLNPGSYSIKFLFDLNEDAEWTSGTVFPRTSPEPFYFYTGKFELRANWESENNTIIIPNILINN